MTQLQIVKDYLLRGNRITQRKAISYFGIIRLSAIIYTLRHKQNIPIKTVLVKNLYIDGQHASYYIDPIDIKNIKK